MCQLACRATLGAGLVPLLAGRTHAQADDAICPGVLRGPWDPRKHIGSEDAFRPVARGTLA
ncbi:hypothetical protein C8P66_12527 [Humitalea rosea]|uniref:Uncharacterized protein n=1 Tax=Humitalea rosea TaxID=990373 RepID=A0A2W7I1M2_9PROT|nr:hypothetical protein C8P66_12527 [Humitalea rosea]